jgi:hypothetical protein
MTSLVSPAEVAARCPAAASHDQTDLQRLIDANEILMNGYLSAAQQNTGSTTIRVPAYGFNVVLLPERVGSISQIVEHWYFTQSFDQTLAADDWYLAPDGTAVHRRFDGTHQREYFSDEISITYIGVETAALRESVLISLTCFDVGAAAAPGGNPNAGLSSRRLGDYSESFGTTGGNAAASGVSAEKEKILAQLIPVVGLPIFA